VASQEGPAGLVEVVGVDLVVPGIHHVSKVAEAPAAEQNSKRVMAL
jgi:hypothetical protein